MRCAQVVRRTWDWLAEQPEDAAELAVLLFEAAPKLKISAGGSGGASQPPKASRRSSYKEEGGSRHRLSAGVPCPIGVRPFLDATVTLRLISKQTSQACLCIPDVYHVIDCCGFLQIRMHAQGPGR